LLLLITGSVDGTADRIVQKSSLPVFRLNLDIFSDYTMEISPGQWSITDPTGRSITNENASRVFWWKAFSYGLTQDAFLHEELKYIFREIYSWFGFRDLVIGNSPYADRFLGKIRQLEIGQKYFTIPNTKITLGKKYLRDSERAFVIKPLSSGLTSSSKAMFTQEVDLSMLDSNLPWYIQEKQESTIDVTVLKVGDKLFGFSRSRANLTGLDWRVEQFSDNTPWEVYEFSHERTRAINGLCAEIGVNWGRLDFLEVDEELVFLEINLNGQWVFLDPENKTGMLDSVVHFIETGPTHS